MRSWKQTVKADMTASGTLSDEGTRRFTGSKSVTIFLGCRPTGPLLDSASLASLPGLVLRSATRVHAAIPAAEGA